MFPLGIPVLLFEEKSAREDWLWLEKSLWRVLISVEEKSSGILVVHCSTGELFLDWGEKKLVVIWSKSRLCSKLLRIMKFTIFWSYSRLHIDLLGNMKLTAI